MDTDVERFSPKRLARINGCLGLIGIVTGAFDIGYVRNALVVTGDAHATVQNILAHETLFRMGFAAHLLLLLCNIPAEIISLFLYRRVNVIIAAIAMSCGLVGTAIEGLALLNAYVPLQIASDAAAHGGFSAEQLQTASYVSVQLENAGLLISFVFYGLDEMLGGLLIFRSGFLPRVIGVLLGIAGLCYLSQGFLSFMAPALDAKLFPYILFPCLPGEGSYALWLAIAGVNVVRWNAWGDGGRNVMAA